MSQPFYITTPIYYVNDVPHLGHAYATIAADTFARFHRMRGDDARFLTGTDEHGQKVEEAATKRGLTPRALVDEVAPRFDATWRELGIDRYRFIRTTNDKHKRVVANLWKRIRKDNPDDLYLESYQGWYCVACEAFYTESQLVRDGDAWVCAIHKRPVTWLDKERSWFFRLSRYAEPLLRHIEQHPDFIRPEQYRNEIVAFLRGGLKDLSVSRTSFSWGIPVPEPDPQGKAHVIYVWMDALVNYLTDLCPDDGTIGGETVTRYWPHAVHLIGKDILRFHAVYWPAFLMAAGLPLPKTIFATGWWTVKGEKISKSMPATRIDPVKLADALGVSWLGRAIGIDAMRYYLLREIPLGADGDFTFESLFGRFNAELANDLGNLVNRALTLIGKSPLEPARDPYLAGSDPHASLERLVGEVIAGAAADFEAFAPSRALETIWKLVREANRYVDQTQPWQLAKDPAKTAELAHVFHNLANAIGVIGGLVSPVLPTTGRVLREWVGIAESEPSWPRAEDMHRVVGRVTRDHKPLYPRLDDTAQQKIVDTIVPPEAAATAHPPKPEAPSEIITKDVFDRVDLRVGKILEARAIPKKDRVLELRVDLGEPEPRTIVAGIAQHHKPETLVGKSCVFVANLAPRDMGKGLVSRGMILAAGDEAILTAVAGDVPPGTRVR
ncbi:MAG TPA: methionine--tRNA ligase [Kofleriaceae bacterium]|nr:methionine--tRNA ligase [Kofleriaceae bacterium]